MVAVKSPDAQDCRNAVTTILNYIGEDPFREGLVDTPDRIIKSWGRLFGGYQSDPAKILERTFEEECDQMVVLRDIEFYSTCEHHMIPFFGRASIGYLPHGKVVGISKLARLLECFARRLQVQERLTNQVADAITKHLQPLGVGVVIKAQHLCMTARGVEKQNSVMVTSAMQGLFLGDVAVRREFLGLVK